jgi:hypothetical protein
LDRLVSEAFIKNSEFPKPYRIKANDDTHEKPSRRIIASSLAEQAVTWHFALYSSAVFALSCFVNELFAVYLILPLPPKSPGGEVAEQRLPSAAYYSDKLHLQRVSL